ncbi:MAG: AAA family ATPase [Desulfomicrobium sp.]|nr:AAA family ATPase [Desulfomicrobium sp.]
MYLTRTLEKFISGAAASFPVILLTGARQVGKTTLLRALGAETRTYVTLDDPLVLQLARQDPALFMQRFTAPVLIDEIQYAPGLLPFIKMAVDENRTPGRFWLTGSQQFQLMNNVSESLAGRVGIVHMLGLSRMEAGGSGREQGPFLPGPDLFTAIAGGPAALSSSDNRNLTICDHRILTTLRRVRCSGRSEGDRPTSDSW